MKLRRLGFYIVLFVLAAILAAGLAIRSLLITPYKGYTEPMLAVNIPPGSSVNSIAYNLHRKGVIRHPWLLKGLFIVQKTEGQSKAGDYVFDRPLSPIQVYEKLMKGEMQYRVFTVIEGTTIFDIQRNLESKGISKPEEFAQAIVSAKTLQALRTIDPDLKSPEGFLFPETYFLTRWEDTQKAVLLMLRQFYKQYGVGERNRAKELGMTTLQVVTLASLVEKETGHSSERPLVSGVFHNRLKRSMLLQCDPTVIYALLLAGTFDGHISRADLQYSSPYNTYVSPGLPPGPICNPGKASILAALYPQETEMLYFVSKNDGSHYFSATLQEHNRAVRKYQQNR